MTSIKKLIELSKNEEIEAAFLVQTVTDPERHGIVTTKKDEDISLVSKDKKGFNWINVDNLWKILPGTRE